MNQHPDNKKFEVLFVPANGLRFGYIEEGRGPLVLLLHGFPDTAHSWDLTRPILAKAGYRAVSPFLRGYAPTVLPAGGRCDMETLGRDVLALIEALGEERAVVVGHDWGAVASFAAAHLNSSRIRFLVTVAVPHLASLRPKLRLLYGARHMLRLRLPGAEALVRKNEFAYVEKLVRRWSPCWQFPASELEAVKEVFRTPGSLRAALRYYSDAGYGPPAFMSDKLTLPSAAFSGDDDPTLYYEDFEHASTCYAAPHQIIRMPGGHFLHREHPQRFHEELLALLQRHAPTVKST